MLRFKPGRFYTNDVKQIAVIGEVKSYRWGKMLVIEEYIFKGIQQGFSIGCMEDTDKDMEKVGGWIEISAEEYKRNFVGETCYYCGHAIKPHHSLVPTEKGMAHGTCYSHAAKVATRLYGVLDGKKVLVSNQN